MANAQQYNLYIANTIHLAQTMVVKHAGVADAINQALLLVYNTTGNEAYDVNLADPSSWKYYLNLAGSYHASDTMMQVISQDTLQTIDFTVANLAVNTATAQAYAPGSSYYLQLVAKYPTQELLIRGILHPIPIPTSLAAPDGTILWHDPSLVEANEMSLVLDIQQWIQTYLRRWYVAAFANADDLYLAACLGVMFSTLPSIILALRLKYVHTYQAHSYHITQFLASHGNLDAYAASMTKPQMLYFYRNIRYLQRNAGQQQTFRKLIDHLLTPRNLPLTTWGMTQNLATLETDLVPAIQFEQSALNAVAAESAGLTRTVQELLAYELNSAPANEAGPERQAEVTQAMTWGKFDALATKVLESSALDTTDAAPYRLSDCLLNHWLYFASLGMYRAVVTVPDPVTGDTFTFTMLDAFIVYVYAYGMGYGLLTGTEAVPNVWANKVIKRPLPPTTEIMNLVDMTVLDQVDLQAVLFNAPLIPNQFLSISAFYTAVNAIHRFELYQHALFSTQGHTWKRAYLETATLYCFRDYEVALAPNLTFPQWFAQRGVDLSKLTTSQYQTLANDLVTGATGINLNTVESMANVQQAMLNIMRQLSSYSVQYLREINNSPIIVLERPSMRVGEVDSQAAASDHLTIPTGELFDLGAGGADTTAGIMAQDVSAYDWYASSSGRFEHLVNADVLLSVQSVAGNRVPMPQARVLSVKDNLDFSLANAVVGESSQYHPVGLTPLANAFSGLSVTFYTVTAADTAAMQAAYNAYIAANGTPVGLLSDVIKVTTLPPFWVL